VTPTYGAVGDSVHVDAAENTDRYTENHQEEERQLNAETASSASLPVHRHGYNLQNETW